MKLATTQNELLALWCTSHLLHRYLEKCRFIARANYEAVKWLLNMTKATSKLTLRQLRRLELDSNDAYHSGIKYKAPDALLRIRTGGEVIKRMEGEIP